MSSRFVFGFCASCLSIWYCRPNFNAEPTYCDTCHNSGTMNCPLRRATSNTEIRLEYKQCHRCEFKSSGFLDRRSS